MATSTSKKNVPKNTGTKSKKTQNNQVRQRVIIENKNVNKKGKTTKKTALLLMIGMLIGVALVLIGTRL